MRVTKIPRIAFTVFGIGLIAWGAVERYHLYATQSSGREAIVESVDGQETKTARGGARSHSAQFTFTTESGARVSGRRPYRDALAQDIQDGRPVKVFYRPERPEDFTLEKADSPWAQILMGAILIIIALAAG